MTPAPDGAATARIAEHAAADALVELAAMYAHGIAKKHGFVDGNTRTALRSRFGASRVAMRGRSFARGASSRSTKWSQVISS